MKNSNIRRDRAAIFRSLNQTEVRFGFLDVMANRPFREEYDDWAIWPQERYELGRRMGAAYVATGAKRPTGKTLHHAKRYLEDKGRMPVRYITATGSKGHKMTPVAKTWMRSCAEESRLHRAKDEA